MTPFQARIIKVMQSIEKQVGGPAWISSKEIPAELQTGFVPVTPISVSASLIRLRPKLVTGGPANGKTQWHLTNEGRKA